MALFLEGGREGSLPTLTVFYDTDNVQRRQTWCVVVCWWVEMSQSTTCREFRQPPPASFHRRSSTQGTMQMRTLQSINQSINEWMNEWMNEWINQSINQIRRRRIYFPQTAIKIDTSQIISNCGWLPCRKVRDHHVRINCLCQSSYCCQILSLIHISEPTRPY